MSIYNDIREDLRLMALDVHHTSTFNSQIKILMFYDAASILILYRLKKLAAKYHIFGFHTLIRIFMLIRYGVEISIKTEIGHGTQLVHLGIVIGDNIKIGKNCKLYGANTLGSARGQTGTVVGDNVEIGCGARILGPLSIGDNVLIGANAVVLKDIPSNTIAIGIPAKAYTKS